MDFSLKLDDEFFNELRENWLETKKIYVVLKNIEGLLLLGKIKISNNIPGIIKCNKK